MSFELRNISMKFGSIRVLHGLNLTLNNGDRVGLTGKNGSGKSTVVNVATGFMVPDAGSIHLDEKPLNGKSPCAYARTGIARTFQKPRVLKSCSLGNQLGQHQITIDRARNILSSIDTAPSLNAFADEVPLSSLKQFEVTRALAMQPRILFLDEPSAGLSETEISDLTKLVSDNLDPSCILVVVEHRKDFITKVTDRVLSVVDGVVEKLDLREFARA